MMTLATRHAAMRRSSCQQGAVRRHMLPAPAACTAAAHLIGLIQKPLRAWRGGGGKPKLRQWQNLSMVANGHTAGNGCMQQQGGAEMH